MVLKYHKKAIPNLTFRNGLAKFQSAYTKVNFVLQNFFCIAPTIIG